MKFQNSEPSIWESRPSIRRAGGSPPPPPRNAVFHWRVFPTESFFEFLAKFLLLKCTSELLTLWPEITIFFPGRCNNSGWLFAQKCFTDPSLWAPRKVYLTSQPVPWGVANTSGTDVRDMLIGIERTGTREYLSEDPLWDIYTWSKEV